MLESKCHRCGAHAPSGPFRRTICVRCAVEGERESVPDLDTLIRRGAPSRDDRISLASLEGVDRRLAAPSLPPKRRSPPWSMLAGVLLLGALIGASGTAAVDHALAGDAKPGVQLVLHAKMKTGHATRAAQPVDAPPAEQESAPGEPESVAPADAGAVEAPQVEATPTRSHTRTRTRTRARPSPPPASTELPEASPPAPDPGTEPAQTLPALPHRRDVSAAFQSVHDQVQGCGDIELIGTTVVARVVFDGASGRARHVLVNESSVPPEVRSCVARVARAARVAPFSNEELIVRYPFRL